MIAYLRGVVDSYGEDWIILEVNGIGYYAHCTSRTIARLPTPGETITLYVEVQFRSETFTLYGFLDRTEQYWFRLLNTVQGIGARVALRILSAIPPEQLVHALATQNQSLLTCAAGVGLRLARRILVELKDKSVGGLEICVDNGNEYRTVYPISRKDENKTSQITTDAISVLVNLGYSRTEAFTMVTRAAAVLATSSIFDVGILVRAALRNMVKSE